MVQNFGEISGAPGHTRGQGIYAIPQLQACIISMEVMEIGVHLWDNCKECRIIYDKQCLGM